MNMQEKEGMKQIQLSSDQAVSKGVYANLMMCGSSKEEFLLDFFNVFPPKGIHTARIIVSPGHLKRMIKVLRESLEKYEKQFGGIVTADEPKGSKWGFNSE